MALHTVIRTNSTKISQLNKINNPQKTIHKLKKKEKSVKDIYQETLQIFIPLQE